MWLEAKVEPRVVLEKQTALHAVLFASNDNQWGGKAQHLEIFTQLSGIPHLPMLGFQGFSASWLGIDLS
jgi:hypothetical protein